MGKVLKADGSVASAYVEVDVTPQSDFWLSYRMHFPADALAVWLGAGSSPYFHKLLRTGHIGVDDLTIDNVGWFLALAGDTASPAPVADVWAQIEEHYVGADTAYLYINGALAVSGAAPAASPRYIRIGLDETDFAPDPTSLVYFDDVKVGTTRGGTDLFSDGFESGTLAAWTSTSGSVSVVDDPFPSAPSTEGGLRVYVAFSDPALEETPTWTLLSGLTGVGVQTFDIKRGRPSEREKTGIGTATINGVDTAGTLDPTNPGVVAPIVPNKQVRIDLHDPVADAWTTIYRGFVSTWRYNLDLSETVFDWTLECKDALGILSDAEMIPDTAGNTVPVESTGDVYYDPQPVDDRIFALLADAALSVGVTEWPAGLTSIFTGNVTLQGTVYSPRTSILQGIDDAADAEFPGVANRYASKAGIVTFHGRLARFDPTNPAYGIDFWKVGDQAAFAGDSATAVISPLEFEVSEDNLINAALATPTGIADSAISGQFVKDATSIAAYGARSISFENLITQLGHDAFGVYNVSKEVETKKVASYYVDNFKAPQARVSQVTILHRNPTDPRASAAWGLLCGVEISDVATLTTTHPGGGGFGGVDFFVEGIGYRGVVSGHTDYAQVELTLDISPRAYFDTNPYA